MVVLVVAVVVVLLFPVNPALNPVVLLASLHQLARSFLYVVNGAHHLHLHVAHLLGADAVHIGLPCANTDRCGQW